MRRSTKSKSIVFIVFIMFKVVLNWPEIELNFNANYISDTSIAFWQKKIPWLLAW